MFAFTTFPNYRQLDQMDCGPTCLKIIAKHYGRELRLDYLRRISSLENEGVSMSGLSDAMVTIGLDAIGIRTNLKELVNDVPLPAVAHWENNHFLVVYKTTKKSIYVSDPAIGLARYGYTEFMEKWASKNGKGILLLAEPTHIFKEFNDENVSYSGIAFLKRYLLPFKDYIGQLFLGIFLASIIQLLLPFLTQSLVDYGIDYGNLNFIHLIVIAQIFLFLTILASEIIRDWLLLHMSTQINISMVSDFLDKILLLPIAYFDSKSTGDFMQRIYDHHRIDEFLGGRSLSIIFDLFSILVFAVVLGYFDIEILVIFLIGTSLFMGWTLLYLKRKALLDHQLFNLNRREQSLLLQMITAVREIRLNGSERRRKLEWKKLQIRLYSLKIKILRADQVQLKGGSLFNEMTNILIIFWSAKAVVYGEITLGAMLAIQFIVGSLSIPIANTLDFIVGLQRATLSLKRLSEIHSQELDIMSHGDTSALELGDIIITGLDFRYGERTAQKVLHNIHATIPKNRVTAIVGPSGSGKTTLLKILLKIYQPNNGNILIGKENLKYVSPKIWIAHCGAVLQDSMLFNDTLERNITESNSNRPTNRKLLREAVQMANLTELVENLPLGYNTRIGHWGNTLSGGEKQRMLIARAIYNNPDYLFFDEATSALDAKSEMMITKNLKSFYSGKTVILVAHRLSTVRNADQILVMDKGRIVEQGHHHELLKRKGRYYDLISNQL
ncbi:Toxin RTX-I translocation ATP-binding protein [Arenibacter antarcticus]|uniref:Peptidase domain-containing ABC transporter n=1 Tax=Arenibacter antarcticus TaxID=2040469 RepID=A0ABW5VD90_9FLAO|nr:peptidase domain-containing ABC transporter [Arenibacter sp. H213]MCM4168393.1 ABC transporter ATP-binding protein [Arenibacter sp. H213]